MPRDMDDRPLHIDLDLRLQGDEVAGRAATEGLPERDFDGWVELLAALDALISEGQS
jgi:hypothetical protein